MEGSVQAPDTVTVSLPFPVDGENAPVAINYSERVIFAHLYQPLFAIDCLGKAQPLIAAGWSRSRGGRMWSFRIRRGIRFWDGSELSASDIIGSWNRNLSGEIRARAGIDSVRSEGDYVINLYLDHSCGRVPRILAAPDFHVAKSFRISEYPVGTGPYRPVEAGEGLSGEEMVIKPSGDHQGPVIRFVYMPGDEVLDRLGERVDVSITSDPSVVSYAREVDNLFSMPLPWSRTYLLISSTRVNALRNGEKVTCLADEIREDLANNAVRAEARGSTPGSWCRNLGGCSRLAGITRYQHRFIPGFNSEYSGWRVLYHKSDRTAGELAGRMVALSSGGGDGRASSLAGAVPGIGKAGIMAYGVSSDELYSSLAAGRDFAYIIPVSSQPADRCVEALALIGKARWLAGSGVGLEETVMPLVDIRYYLIAGRKLPALSLDRAGGIFFVTRPANGR
ncbi:MAG: ABC transporter substrate-binding protein [Candidatus Krumholzibacteriales bacterium]